jgi:hypothetical protein
MGQALIKSHLGEGLYSVAYRFDTSRRDALIARLDRAIATLEARQAIVSEELIKVNAEYNALAKANPPPVWDALYAKRQERNAVIREYRAIDAQLVSLRVKRMYRGISPDDETLHAWCADLTEDLSGIVGTIEIDGLPGYDGVVKLRPGHADGAAYDYTRDGIVQKTETADPAAAFWNLAMAPGWQRWRPTFRIAVISDIDTESDTCTVTLEPAVSQIRPRREDLDINERSVIHGVPVQYMTCNARAFDPGDRVIVEFQEQDISRPRVIGFADHPKGCGGFRFNLKLADGSQITPENAASVTISLYNSTLTASASFTKAQMTYDEDTDEWVLPDLPELLLDDDGYYAVYSCTDGYQTHYPHKYKTADRFKVLMQPGAYADMIHLWRIGAQEDDPEAATIESPSADDLVPAALLHGFVYGTLGTVALKNLQSVRSSIKVFTSMEFRVSSYRPRPVTGFQLHGVGSLPPGAQTYFDGPDKVSTDGEIRVAYSDGYVAEHPFVPWNTWETYNIGIVITPEGHTFAEPLQPNVNGVEVWCDVELNVRGITVDGIAAVGEDIYYGWTVEPTAAVGSGSLLFAAQPYLS